MPRVIFIDHTGARHEIQAPLNKNLMQVAVDNGVPSILGDCGGCCSCATCHGYVDEPWAARLPAQSDTELFLLEGVPGAQTNSRLCCQIRLTAELDGITVRLPETQL